MVLFDLHAGVLDHFAPFRDLVRNEFPEGSGRAGHGIGAETGDAFTNVAHLQLARGVEAGHGDEDMAATVRTARG